MRKKSIFAIFVAVVMMVVAIPVPLAATDVFSAYGIVVMEEGNEISVSVTSEYYNVIALVDTDANTITLTTYNLYGNIIFSHVLSTLAFQEIDLSTIYSDNIQEVDPFTFSRRVQSSVGYGFWHTGVGWNFLPRAYARFTSPVFGTMIRPSDGTWNITFISAMNLFEQSVNSLVSWENQIPFIIRNQVLSWILVLLWLQGVLWHYLRLRQKPW